jgi:predicted enzyme related to lactoylglutathione lyase
MHAINWFEIPTVELGRAVTFYRHILGASIKVDTFGGIEHGFFDKLGEGAVSGALVRDPRRAPSDAGTLVYLAADGAPGGLDGVLARVAASGGKVTLPKMSIGEHGSIGLFVDTEGNLVGLHSQERL